MKKLSTIKFYVSSSYKIFIRYKNLMNFISISLNQFVEPPASTARANESSCL
jgi:hypothetical protein